MPTLVLTPRYTEDAQALWRAAIQLGWEVERLAGWRIPDHLRGVPEPVLYLEGLFGPTLAAEFGLRLLEPDVDWLPRLPLKYKLRSIELVTFGEAKGFTWPVFAKPPNDKSFPAKVYAPGELAAIEAADDAPVLVATPATWEKEFRFFVLDRKPVTASIYLRKGIYQRDAGFAASEKELDEAWAFVSKVLDDPGVFELPKAVVVDVGVMERGWAVVEANPASSSGIYGCDPLAVLEVLRHAAVPI